MTGYRILSAMMVEPSHRNVARGGRLRLLVGLAIVLGMGVSFSGCVKPLFPKNQPRTQFETYDKLRNRQAPLEEPDVFGRPQPALRSRLTPPQ